MSFTTFQKRCGAKNVFKNQCRFNWAHINSSEKKLRSINFQHNGHLHSGIQTKIKYRWHVGILTTTFQAKFKKLYQRKVKNSDEAVATIQDIKDVAIFTTKRENLFPEFITYFHTVSVDKFLRSMLVYFQYYLQVISALFKAI